MNHVEAHIAGAHLAQNGIQIGAVVIEQTPGVVHRRGNLPDLAVEQAQGARIREHDTGGAGPQGDAQGGQVQVAIRPGGNLPDLVTAHDRRGRVGPVGGVRDQYLRAGVVPPGPVIGADHGHPGEFPLGTGGRRQGDRVHPADRLEHLLQLIQTGQNTLAVTVRGQRMTPQKTRQRGQTVAGPGVVLHGAGTQGIKMGIDGKIPLG